MTSELREQGYTAVKTGRVPYTHYDFDMREVKHTEQLLQSLLNAAGDEMDILLDFHGRPFSPRAALAYIDACSPARPMFVEEPIQPGDHVAMAQIAQLAKCPIATGERLITHREYEDLCGLRAVTYVQPDLSHCGGFTVGKQIAATAATSASASARTIRWDRLRALSACTSLRRCRISASSRRSPARCPGTLMSCRRRSVASMAIGSCRLRPASVWRSMKKQPCCTRSSKSRLRRWMRCCGEMAPSPIGDIAMETLLITGATGNIGQKLRENLEATGKYASMKTIESC